MKMIAFLGFLMAVAFVNPFTLNSTAVSIFIIAASMVSMFFVFRNALKTR